jgi:ribonuclease-3
MGILRRVRSLFGRQKGVCEVDLSRVEEVIGYTFRDRELLLLALTHRSYSHSLDIHQPSNERLEFLGDSALGLIISDQLYRDNPDIMEGELTKTKSLLVNESALCEVALEVGLNLYIRLSPEEDRLGGRQRASISSDAFESVIGAAYLDGGLDAARDIVLRLIYARKDSILSDESRRNYKGELLELSQARAEGLPRYEVQSESGPDHAKVFQVAVLIGGDEVGTGTGNSKKEAEQKAACQALHHFQNHSD